MKNSKTAWIPAVVFGLPALALWGITLWGGCVPAPYEGLFSASFRGFSSFTDVLSLTDFYGVVLQSLLLRLGSAAGGCLLGFGISLLLRRAPSGIRAAAGALLLLPLFVPPALWCGAGPLARCSFTVRALVAGGVKAAGLSAFAGCLFHLRRKTSGAFLVLLALLCAFLSPDPESALLESGAGEMVLDAWILSRVRDPMAFAASFIRLTAEMIAAVPAALCLHSLTLSRRSAPPEECRERSAYYPLAVFGAAVLLSCLVLLPFLLGGGTLAMEERTLSPLRRSLLAAAGALPAAFAAAALILFTCGKPGKGSFVLLTVSLFTLSAFSAVKPLLFSLAGLLPTFVPTALDAVFSQEAVALVILIVCFSHRRRSALLFGAAGCALLAACRAAFSLSGLKFYSYEGLSSLQAGAGSMQGGSAGVWILTVCLVLYILSALCFSRLLLWEPAAERSVKAGQVQGFRAAAVPVTRTAGEGAPAVTRQRPLFDPPDTPALSDTPQVPASSAYSEQFARNAAWMPPRAPAPSLPVEEEEAPAEEPAPQPAAEAPVPAEPEAAESPFPDAPSPAQVVGLINALTKMRSLGIVSDMEYREKRDRLMKML